MLRGTPKFDSVLGLSTCEGLSWAILGGFILIGVLMTVYNVRDIFRENALKMKYGQLHESERFLCGKNLLFILSLAMLSGFVGQMFGVGGGFMYGPMLLMLGVSPLVSSSTCLYMILFSNGVSFFQFAVYGQLNYIFVGALGLFVLVGVVGGMLLIGTLMKKYKRPSLIAFALGVAIVISTVISIIGSAQNLTTKI